MHYQRQFVSLLTARFKEKQPLIQIVIGPRQVGKTTGILQFLKQYEGPHHYCSADALLTENITWLHEQWQTATLKGKNALLAIDEVQKIPNWSDAIKQLWDKEQTKQLKIKLLLTGSSSLSLTTGMSESLAGRFEVIKVNHWDYSESNALKPMSLATYLLQGGYPKSYDFLEDKERWQAYLIEAVINRVIDKDILNYAQVKKPALFRQAFELVCCYPAQEISYRKLLGQLQDKGNVDLIKHYLALFESAFLIKTLQKYQKQDFKTKSSSPKILILAPCFYHLLSQKEEKQAFVFESTIGAKLLQITNAVYYWRHDLNEVDFVIEWNKKLIAIEVKSGRKRKLNGLEKFMQSFPKAIPIVISMENYNEFISDPRDFLKKLTV